MIVHHLSRIDKSSDFFVGQVWLDQLLPNMLCDTIKEADF